jgi:transcriptional regulator with XRE-family HTH domain
MDEFNLIFANKLLELRRDNNEKQETLAKEFKISQQAYSKLERGIGNFNNSILKKICNYFCISAAEFLNTGSQTKYNNSPQANTHNSFNNELILINELISSKDKAIATKDELITSKDEIIASQKELIQQLKESIALMKKK